MNILCVSAFPERRSTISAEFSAYGLKPRFVDAPRGMEAALRGWKPAPTWRDPFGKRLLTWGELACMAGHDMAWELAGSAGPEGTLIVEDDVQLTGDPARFIRRGDLVYLSHKFIEPAGHPEDGLVKAPYTYWTCAYWLSVEGARKLHGSVDRTMAIPADEFVPHHFGKNPNVASRHLQAPPAMIEAWALPRELARPSGRWHSSTESSEPAYELRTAVWATERAKARLLTKSLDDHGWTYEVLMEGRSSWKWDTNFRGGIRKLESLSGWLRRLDESRVRAIALALDGYDVMALSGPEDVLKRYGEMGSRIIVGGELNCWPEKSLAPKLEACQPKRWPGEDNPVYRYPNTGTLIGMAHDMLREVSLAHANHVVDMNTGERPDDQHAIQSRIIDAPEPWRIDREGYLFQTLGSGGDKHMEHDDGLPRNRLTGCRPAFIHANGHGRKAAQVLTRVGPRKAGESIELASNAGHWNEIGTDILAMPWLRESAARALAEAVNGLQGWQPLPGDNVPGDELRLREWSAAQAKRMDDDLDRILGPVVETFWRPATWRGASDVFFIRYSKDRQPSLRLHEDISYVSCSIKLRPACAGGELWWPRQNVTDALIPVGWLVAWPSRVTHPHQVKPVTRGRRMSIVVWTKSVG